MKKKEYILGLSVLLLLAGCTTDDTLTENGQGKGSMDSDPVGQPVLFTSGNENTVATRADGVPYMTKDGRFVCTMYYHPEAGATDSSPFDIKNGGTDTTAWLQVNDNVGNSVYRKSDFSTPASTDTYGFDESATKFYWQNRLTHAFLALADYNKLKENVGNTTEQGKLKMFPNHDIDFIVPAEGEEDTQLLANNRYANKYDLKRGTSMSKMTDQPDPILALTIMKPAGATQEANRVRLYFRHQFSQIQVNIKGPDDGSADIQPEQIDKVELLGVSEEGYVACRLNANGTVGLGTKPLGNILKDGQGTPIKDKDGKEIPDEDIMLGSASAKEVKLDSYTTAQLEQNKWGTSFNMFDMTTGVIEDGHDTGYALGYLKSFNAIAFGTLWAIRVTWHELAGNQIQHVSTYEVPATNQMTGTQAGDDNKPLVYLRELQSGMRYVYDFELRRGTLAVIRTQILDWLQKPELVYATDGTIVN